MQYRRTPRAEGYSPSELLNSRQIRTKIDILLPSTAHTAQGSSLEKLQSLKLKRSQTELHSVGMPCYALYWGPRHEKDTRWVPAVVTKALGTRSVNVRMFTRGGTGRRHIEQLRPHYGAQEDADPGEDVSVAPVEPFPGSSTTEVATSTHDTQVSPIPSEESRAIAQPM